MDCRLVGICFDGDLMLVDLGGCWWEGMDLLEMNFCA